MQSETRKAELIKIRETKETITMTGANLIYQGKTVQMDVHKIPLKYLIYNKYNGRIGSRTKTFERQHYSLNPEEKNDRKIIEGYLYNSKPERNKNTMWSLIKSGQQKYGIVTSDGVIIDGNRRAMLLNRAFEKRAELKLKYQEVEHCQNFLAIILPDDATVKDIQQLETIYQMGEDAKLDYNPIEKYLKCADLIEQGFTEKDISEFMGEKEPTIKKWLSMLDLMNEYLETYDSAGIYTLLDKTEGQFQDLDNYLRAYKNNHKTTSHVNWDYDDSDLADLKIVCFDYIRSGQEGKSFREIARTGTKGCIFANKNLWENFLDEHTKKIPQEDKTIEELQQDFPNETVEELLIKREADWKNSSKRPLEGNLNKYISKLEDVRNSNMPLQLLEKANDALHAIDIDNEALISKDALKLVRSINKLSWDMKKLLDRSLHE